MPHIPLKSVNLWSPRSPDLYYALLTPHWQRNGGQHDNNYYFGVFSLLFRQRTPLLRFTASSRRPFPNRCPPSPLRKGKVRKNKKQRERSKSSSKIHTMNYIIKTLMLSGAKSPPYITFVPANPIVPVN